MESREHTPDQGSDESQIQGLLERRSALKEEIPAHQGEDQEHLTDELESVELELYKLGVTSDPDPDLEQ